MSSSFAATDRERYEELLAALEELAQVVSTLHGLVTLDGTDLTDLVVENLAALLDDAKTAGDQSHARLSLDPAAAVRAAAEHRRLVHAIRRTTQALQEAVVTRIDAQAPAVRSELVDANRRR